MTTAYDENVKDNPFYQFLVEHHYDLLEKVSAEDGWFVCVPCKTAVNRSISNEDIFSHIIVPNSGNNGYRTLNKVHVEINGRGLIVNNRLVEILFKETFYLRNLKFVVYCIEHALNEHRSSGEPVYLNNLRDCVDFLWNETLGREVLLKINELCEEFINAHQALCLYTMTVLQNYTEALYINCLMLVLNCNDLQNRTGSDEVLFCNIKLATETYMQHCLGDRHFNAIVTSVEVLDVGLNKAIRNVQDIQLKQLGLTKYHDLIGTARSELIKINHFATSLGKLNCLLNVFEIFSNNGKCNLISSDFLQLLAFLVVKLNINNWYGNLVYLQKFVFSRANEYDKNSYLLTTLEAALEYVKSIKYNFDCDNQTSQNALFESIRYCRLDKIELLLKESARDDVKLCHPLCSCDNCENSLKETEEYSVRTLDEKGRSCLHLACIYGYPHLVDYFIHKGASVGLVDFSGSEAIHYAASLGHQNALLLLLHAGADLNGINGDSNTALHLCCNSGHDSCVKALLYYSEHRDKALDVDACNNNGNTALHLAAQWGFLSIVNILLQHDCDCSIKNKRNQTALDVAQNYFVKKALLESGKKKGVAIAVNTKTSVQNDFAFNTRADGAFGIRPKDMAQFKKTILLLRAIENNDLPLSCFYLSIPVPLASSSQQARCHPLCVCEKCADINSISSCVKKENLNINICNKDGYTSLHTAAEFGRTEIFRVLLDAGANINLQTYTTLRTPLHIACDQQRLSIVKQLLQCGNCDVDKQDATGNTALHLACMRNNAGIVELLLGREVDMRLKNGAGRTALQEAEDRLLFGVVRHVKSRTTAKREFV